MADKKALIIGGGIAGLCTGVYLRRLGFDTEILEMRATAGGLATAWRKGGFTFENCIHWLVGSKDGGWLNSTWKEVFDISQLEFFDDPVFEVLERGADRITIYRDADRLEAELLAKAPQDAAAVKEFVGLVRRIAGVRMPEGDDLLRNIGAFLTLVPNFPALSKYGKLSMADYSKRFTHPVLRSFFSAGISDLSLLAIVFSLAWMARGNAGYPIGGSRRMIGLIEESFKRLGGRIRFKAGVERIKVEDGRAVGVVLRGGEEQRADIVVSAADGHATIFDMLDGQFTDDRIRSIYRTYKPFPSYVQVSLGLDADLGGEPGTLVLLLDRDIQIDPETTADEAAFRVFNFDPTFAPPGKTAVTCILATYNHEVLARAAREGQDSLHGRKGARRRRRDSRVRGSLSGGAGQGHGRGRGDARDHRPLHGQLEGQHGGLALHTHHGHQAAPVCAPGTRELLHGRPVDLARRGIARRPHDGQERFETDRERHRHSLETDRIKHREAPCRRR